MNSQEPIGYRRSLKTESLLLIFFMLLFGIISIAKGQPNGDDIFNYHYYNGYALWNHRFNFDIAVANIQSYFNPLLDALNYWLYTHFTSKTVAFILGAICGLNAYLLYKISAIFFKVAHWDKFSIYCIFLALFLGLTGATALGQVGNPMNDCQSAIPVMFGLYFLLKSLETNRNKYLLLGACMLGIATGLKMTNSVYCLASFLAILSVQSKFSCKSLSTKIILFILASTIGFLLVDGYFAYQLYVLFRNPLFPYYNNIFHSPYFSYETVRDPRFGAHIWYQVFTYPFLLMKYTTWVFSEPACRDWRLGVFLILTFLALIKGFKALWHNPTFTFLFIFLMSSYLIWVLQFGIYRYAIPIQFITGPIIIALLIYLLPNKKWFCILAFILTGIIFGTTLRPGFGAQKDFTPQFINVIPPILPTPSLILITDLLQSYIIPFFPPQDRFIGINLSFELNQNMLANIIKRNRFPIYAMFNYNSTIKDNFNQMNHLGLSLDPSSCKWLNNNIQRPEIKKIEICLIKHSKT